MRRSYRGFRDYANWVAETLKSFTDIIVDYELSVEEATPAEGLVRGRIVFVDGSQLEFLEYVVVSKSDISRLKYRYHYADPDGKLVFRYDNAPHHPEVPSHPHHKHTGDGKVVPAAPPTLRSILEEVLEYIP